MNQRSAIFESLNQQLVVSCQPVDNGPLDRIDFVVGMAQAAVNAGAAAVRIEGVANVQTVANVLEVPIIGIVKRDLHDSPIRITCLEQDIDDLIAAGADIIAVDATERPRPVPLAVLVEKIQNSDCLVMADCSTFEDGLAAAELGCEIIGSTLSGYTGGPIPDEPDYQLIEQWADQGLRIMAEGRIKTPQQAAHALECGAWAVTVGSAITRVEHITSWFVEALRQP